MDNIFYKLKEIRDTFVKALGMVENLERTYSRGELLDSLRTIRSILLSVDDIVPNAEQINDSLVEMKQDKKVSGTKCSTEK